MLKILETFPKITTEQTLITVRFTIILESVFNIFNTKK